MPSISRRIVDRESGGLEACRGLFSALNRHPPSVVQRLDDLFDDERFDEDRFDDDFFDEDFFDDDFRVDFFALDFFFEADFFRAGTFAPLARASDNPIAIACLRLFTLPPLPPRPRLSVPDLRFFIARFTDLPAAFP